MCSLVILYNADTGPDDDGTDIVASDEIRIDDGADYLMVSNDGHMVWANASGGTMVGATNFEHVDAYFAANVWNLKSTKTGTGTVRNMTISADTADLTLSGAHVNLGTSVQIFSGGQFSIYNVDGANFERVRSFWSSNVYTIQTGASGTGVVRPMLLDAPEVRVATLTAGGLVYTAAGSTGELLNIDFGDTVTKHDYYVSTITMSNPLNAGGIWAATSSTSGTNTTLVEYPNNFLAGHIKLKVNFKTLTGVSSTVTCSVTRNGSIISGADVTFLIGITADGVITGTTVATGSASANDTYGLYILGSGATTGATASFSAQVILTP